MVMTKEREAECNFCGSEDVEFRGKTEDEQYGFDTEGGMVNRTYLGTEVKKYYLCRACGREFQVVETREDIKK